MHKPSKGAKKTKKRAFWGTEMQAKIGSRGYDYTVSPEYESWIQAATPYFRGSLGLAEKMAPAAARLYLSLWSAGLSPRIARGYSSAQHQRDLQAAWDRGDRAGLRVRPASTSQHTVTDWLGRPDAQAIDMPSADDARAAVIARSIGLGAGAAFSQPDPGHYFLP